MILVKPFFYPPALLEWSSQSKVKNEFKVGRELTKVWMVCSKYTEAAMIKIQNQISCQHSPFSVCGHCQHTFVWFNTFRQPYSRFTVPYKSLFHFFKRKSWYIATWILFWKSLKFYLSFLSVNTTLYSQWTKNNAEQCKTMYSHWKLEKSSY